MTRTRAARAPSRALIRRLPEAPKVSSDNPIAAFLVFLADEPHVTERTARQYVRHVQRFAGWLVERFSAGLLEATAQDLRAYRGELASSQRPASVNAALAALRRFYDWARATGRLERDLTRNLVQVEEQQLAPKGLSNTERHRLRREAERSGPVTEAIVTLLLNTGLRVDELAALAWGCVSIQPRSGWLEVVGKGSKHRRVPLNVEARQALTAIAPESATGAVFRGRRGPYTARGIEHLLAELGRRADVLDVHPHRFRHDCARRLIDAGVPLVDVAAWLGHERLDTVRIYSHPDEASLERAAAALQAS